MLLSVLAAAAALKLTAPPDLVKPGEDAAFTQGLVGAVANLAQARAGSACPADTGVDFNGANRLGTAAVLLNAKPDDEVAGDAFVYDQKVHVRGCGEQARWDNILMVRKKAGGWLFIPFAPGDTRVSPQLFHDTLTRALALATAGRTPGQTCENGKKVYQLTDTVIVGPPPTGDGAKPTTWQERWIQQSCGADRSVLVTFTTAGGQTQYSVKSAWTPAPAKP
jgi:hypothetical protein